MSQSLTRFTFPVTSQPIRVVERDGCPWFVAADVCAALELGNPSQALARLDDDETTLISNEGRAGHGPQSLTVVNEPGLYSLVLGSRKPEAKAFKRWVTHEVLPAIRKTGQYAVPGRAGQSRPAAETLGHSDRLRLRALVGQIAEGQLRPQVWIQQAWAMLRHAAGRPAPDPFLVDDIPLLAEELRRLLTLARAWRLMIFDQEAAMVRAFSRHRPFESEGVVDAARRQLCDEIRRLEAGFGHTIEPWQRAEVEHFAARKPASAAHAEQYLEAEDPRPPTRPRHATRARG